MTETKSAPTDLQKLIRMNIAGATATIGSRRDAGSVAKGVLKSVECKNLVCPHCSGEISITTTIEAAIAAADKIGSESKVIESRDEHKSSVVSSMDAVDEFPEFDYSMLPESFVINMIAPRGSGSSFLYRDILANIGHRYSDIIHLNDGITSIAGVGIEYKDNWVTVAKSIIAHQMLPERKPVLVIISSIVTTDDSVRNSSVIKDLVRLSRFLKLSVILDYKYISDVKPDLRNNQDICWYLGGRSDNLKKIVKYVGHDMHDKQCKDAFTQKVASALSNYSTLVFFCDVKFDSPTRLCRYKPKPVTLVK